MIHLNAVTGSRLGTSSGEGATTTLRVSTVAGRTDERNGLWSIVRRIPRWMVNGYQRANATDLASAVAFQAMVAVVPMFLLLISVAGLFLQDSSVLKQAILTITWILPPEASIDAFSVAFEARGNSGLFGALSLLGFAWVGTGFVSAMARSMNRIYGAPNAGYLKEKQRGFIVILLFALFFVIASSTSIITTFFVNAESELPLFFRRWFLTSGRYQLLAYGVALLSAFMLFLTIYRLVPNAKQTLKDVWPGAVISALLFVIVSQGFPLYLRFTGGSNRFFGALGLVTLMVATFYALAHVILFGCYVNATWLRHRRERARTVKRRKDVSGPGPRYTPADPQAAKTEMMDSPLR